MKNNKSKIIFLDRDGVINFERGFTHRLEDFKILDGLVEALTELQRRGYILVVVSNQSGIAKELYQQKDVEVLHEFMLKHFEKNNIHLSEIYYCVHHPDVTKCICRKPDSLFIEKALARFNGNPGLSYFIGDKERDIEAGEKAGVKGILIEANTPLTEILHLIE